MRIAKYDENSTSFLAHSVKQKLNESSFAGSKTANYSNGAAVGAAVDKFLGAVAIPGGAVLVPYSGGVVGLLGANGAYTAGPAAAGSARFRGGCLTDNGKVIFAPLLAQNIGIYDIKTNQFTLGAPVSLGTGSGPGFAGCCKMKNGMVLLAPRNRATIGIYNPYTDVYTEGPAHGLSDGTFGGCVPLPDGRVLLIPYDGDFFMLYDYKTNALVGSAPCARQLTGRATQGCQNPRNGENRPPGHAAAPRSRTRCAPTEARLTGIPSPPLPPFWHHPPVKRAARAQAK